MDIKVLKQMVARLINKTISGKTAKDIEACQKANATAQAEYIEGSDWEGQSP